VPKIKNAVWALGKNQPYLLIHSSVLSYFVKGRAFQVFDLTKEQLTSFLSAASDLLVRSKSHQNMNNVIRVAVGLCGIRHAAFMTDISLNLLRECLHMPRNSRTMEHIYYHSQFLTGTCNLWESLLKTERVREKSFASILFEAWQFFTNPMARLPQCGKIAEEAMRIFKESDPELFMLLYQHNAFL